MSVHSAHSASQWMRNGVIPPAAQRSVPSQLSLHLITALSVGFIAAVLVLLAAFWGSNACQTASAAKNLYNTGYSPFSSCCVTRWFRSEHRRSCAWRSDCAVFEAQRTGSQARGHD